jgi:acetyl-CoA acetyltransferase
VTRKHNAAVVGIGQSRTFRYDEAPLGVLAAEACRMAIEDAGLRPSDIDGIACVPHQPYEQERTPVDGVDVISAQQALRSLGIQSRWGANVDVMMGHSVVEAVNAVEAGACTYALVYRALKSPRGGYGHTSNDLIAGAHQFIAPYGSYRPIDFAAIWNRYRDLYGNGTREQMATFVMQARKHGLLWEHGFWTQHRPEPLTLDGYMNARMIASPFCIYDCDIPIQASGAFVITTAERARDLRHPPAYVLGMAAPYFHAPENVVHRDFILESQQDCAKKIAGDLWADCGLSPKDVHTANLYDGFSMITMLWLEALGFCGEGEGFDFIQDGRTTFGGALPLNTAGGNLGAGRMHGVNHVMESVLQVMSRAGKRQVGNAEVVLATVGPPSRAAAMIFGSQPV